MTNKQAPLIRVKIGIEDGLLTNKAILYTVCWIREGERNGHVQLCYGNKKFEDEGLPPDVLHEVQKQLEL